MTVLSKFDTPERKSQIKIIYVFELVLDIIWPRELSIRMLAVLILCQVSTQKPSNFY